jgi:hypothetical protein
VEREYERFCSESRKNHQLFTCNSEIFIDFEKSNHIFFALCRLELPAGRWIPVEESLSDPNGTRLLSAVPFGLRFECALMKSREKNTASMLAGVRDEVVLARMQLALVGIKSLPHQSIQLSC